MSYIDDAVAATMGFEGSIPWMYLDTKGNVTVGCGKLLPTVAAACAVPFQSSQHQGGMASIDEVTVDFRRVQGLAAGKEAGFYRAESSPVVTKAVMTWMEQKVVIQNDQTLAEAFPQWPSFPNSAKIALLDMEYNIGEGETVARVPFDGRGNPYSGLGRCSVSV